MFARFFLSPCGTSLLTNQPISGELRGLLFQTANQTEAALSSEHKESIDKHFKERQSLIQSVGSDWQKIKNLSAELNGILTYYEQCHSGLALPQSVRSQDLHYLISTDTYQGQQVARLVADWLTGQGFYAEVVIIPHLATDDLGQFRYALAKLMQWCRDCIPPVSEQQEVIFNLTGGFKSIQGFLQTVGMFYASKCIYIFQFSSQLLEIPHIPVQPIPEPAIAAHFTLFRRMGLPAMGSALLPTLEDCAAVPEFLLLPVEEEERTVMMLSEWGELAWSNWQQEKQNRYSTELQPSLSPKLVFSEPFIKQVTKANLQPDRLAILNQQFDQLALCIVSNQQENPRSLDFKKLKGNPKPTYTHECDIWNDDKRRLFGYFKDGVYVVDRLERGLE